MTRRNWMGFAAMLLAGLFLAGCGGDDGGLSSEDMARLSAAESAAMTAQEEAEAAQADAAAAQVEAEAAEAAAAAAQAEATAAKEDAATAKAEAEKEVEIPEIDTSAIDGTIATLEATVEELVATPATPVEILGGTKGKGSVADLAVAAMKIAGQLNGRVDKAGIMVNLAGASYTKMAADKRGTYAAGTSVNADDDKIKINSGDGTREDRGFLKHKFEGGPMVDLTSVGDIESLTLKNLLKVNGVDLKAFSVKETDKVRVQTNADGNLAATDAAPMIAQVDATAGPPITLATRMTTLGKDGSMSVVHMDDTGDTTYSQTTSYVGGSKIVEYNPVAATGGVLLVESLPQATVTAGTAAMVTRADGDHFTVGRVVTDGTATYHVEDGVAPGFAGGTGGDPVYVPANPQWTQGTALPAADAANAMAMYQNAKAPTYAVAQHTAEGYGAWLEDSFFVAYVISAEDDLIISDPDAMAMKIAWGGRTRDSKMAANLSGRGETAMWKGLMVGHDMDATADTAKKMLKGNASITARVSEAVLADQAAGTRLSADVVDVSLTNIITGDGTAVSRATDGIHWTNLNLIGGEFAKGTEINGAFYDNGNEVVGQFNKMKILGVFGALEYEMDEMMDMANQ